MTRQSWRRLLLSGAALLTVAGCSSADEAASAPHSALKVHIGVFGGPALPDGQMAAENTPDQGVAITVANDAGHTWRSVTGKDGIAAFSLPGGRYTVTTRACGLQSQAVTVTAGQPAYVDLHCDVP